MSTEGADIAKIDSCEHTLKFFDPDAGEEVCGRCGVVLNQKVETLDIVAMFAGGMRGHDNVVRASETSSITKYDDGLFGYVSGQHVDANGRQINRDAYSDRMDRLNRISAIQTSRLKNLKKAMRTLAGLAERLSLPRHVEERAAYLYRKVLAEDMVRGRSIMGVMGACVYIACRDLGMPVRLEAVQDALDSSSDRDQITEYFRLIVRELHIRLPVQSGTEYLSKMGQQCSISERTIRRAAEIVDAARNDHVSQGKAGISIAAAALYLAAMEAGEEVSQMKLANASEVSTVTIRKRINDLARLANQKVQV